MNSEEVGHILMLLACREKRRERREERRERREERREKSVERRAKNEVPTGTSLFYRQSELNPSGFKIRSEEQITWGDN